MDDIFETITVGLFQVNFRRSPANDGVILATITDRNDDVIAHDYLAEYERQGLMDLMSEKEPA